MTPSLTGILLRLLAAGCGSALAAGVHAVADHLPTGQIIFWRSIVSVLPIVAYMAWRREFPSGLRTAHPWMHVTRSGVGAASMVLFFTALAYLPITSASALNYLAPLLSLPIAAAVLGERIHRGIIGACLLGLAGVLLMLAPKLAGPSLDRDGLIGIAAGLGSAGCMAFVRVHVKTMTRTESAGAIAFYFELVATLLGAASLPLGWVEMTTRDYTIMVVVGLLAGCAHIAANEAAARAPISVLAPFDYTGIVFALAFDLMLFAQRPSWVALCGVGMIIAAGLWMVRMDRRPVRVGIRP